MTTLKDSVSHQLVLILEVIFYIFDTETSSASGFNKNDIYQPLRH